MDKIVQRTRLAVRGATRRKMRRDVQKNYDEIWDIRMRQGINRIMIKDMITNEKKSRKEGWELGPRLAPRRDVGDDAERYATIDQSLLHPTSKSAKHNKGFMSHLAEEDRVVLLAGRDKGKIGRVSAVNEEAQTVKVRGMNQADFFVPDFMRMENGDNRTINPVNIDMPMSDVRLVVALEDSNGNFRDVVVDKVTVERASKYDVKHNDADKRGRRYIPGLNRDLPWPPREEPKYEDHEVDCRRLDVDEVTFTPVLLEEPFPGSIIDELRNKYSAFRTRHDPEYIALKEAQAAAGTGTRQGLLARAASTPMQELIAKNKRERAERQKDLTEEQLAAIGEVMAREKLAAA